ncbi:MAG: hypothetical protein PVJ80_17235 [Gemmatimonadota bacterium]
MNRPYRGPDRRTIDLRDTDFWDRDLNGYAVCPWCAAMIYSDRAAFHQDNCPAAQPERRGRDDQGERAGLPAEPEAKDTGGAE